MLRARVSVCMCVYGREPSHDTQSSPHPTTQMHEYLNISSPPPTSQSASQKAGPQGIIPMCAVCTRIAERICHTCTHEHTRASLAATLHFNQMNRAFRDPLRNCLISCGLCGCDTSKPISFRISKRVFFCVCVCVVIVA